MHVCNVLSNESFNDSLMQLHSGDDSFRHQHDDQHQNGDDDDSLVLDLLRRFLLLSLTVFFFSGLFLILSLHLLLMSLI